MRREVPYNVRGDGPREVPLRDSLFVMRLEPFTVYNIMIYTRRLFCDFSESWWSASKANRVVVKKLILQLYALPRMFENQNQLPLDHWTDRRLRFITVLPYQEYKGVQDTSVLILRSVLWRRNPFPLYYPYILSIKKFIVASKHLMYFLLYLEVFSFFSISYQSQCRQKRRISFTN